MKIGYLQFHPTFGDIENNTNRAMELIDDADCDLLVLPELFSTGYTFTSRHEAIKLSEPIPEGKTTQRLMETAKEKQMAIVFGIAERDENKIYNSSVLVSSNGYVGKYRKIHLYFKEKKWFEKGNLGFPVWQVNDAKIGMMICYDWIYPEAMRVLALKGAEIICHCANLVMPYCQQAMFARSLENHVYVITSNRIGREHRDTDDFTFTGESVILSPTGEYLSRAPKAEEYLDIVSVNLDNARDKQINNLNSLFEDRRLEFYKELVE